MLPTDDMLARLLTALTDRLAVEITIRIEPSSKPTKRASGLTSPSTGDRDIARETTESFDLLSRAGVNGEMIDTLAGEYCPERIRQCIIGVTRQADVKNFPAYLIKALKCNYYRGIVVDESDDSMNQQ